MIKLNTNENFLEHNEKAGIRGIARDNTEEFIFVFVIPIQCNQDHNVAETVASKYFIQWLKNNGHQKGIIEMDSLLQVDMMKNRTSQNRNMKIIVDETADLVGNADFGFTHCYREVNEEWDKMQLTSIRIRYDKSNFFVS